MPCKLIEEAAVCKTAAEMPIRSLSLTDACARTWEAAQKFNANSVIRPKSKADGGRRGASGYEYKTPADGFSGEQEPKWTGESIPDGSLTWARQPLSNDSLARTITEVEWIAPAGITLDQEQLRNTGGIQEIGIRVSGELVDEEDNVIIARVTFSDSEVLDFGFEVSTHAPEPA